MSEPVRAAGVKPGLFRRIRPTQESIVFVLTCLLFVAFALILERFLTVGNMIVLVRGGAVLGMLALAMAVVVIGRGVDLSMVATMVVGVCWALKMTNSGQDLATSLLMGGVFALITGAVIGLIVAYAEVPAVFTTLVMGPVVFGFGNLFFFSEDTHNAPANVEWLRWIGYERILGLPVVIVMFAALAVVVFLLMRYIRFGRSIYALGDNPLAARLSGFPVRPIIVGKYILSALIAFAVGVIIMATNSGMNTRLFYTTLVYDVLLVVVLGGIGLSGGRGGVRNVIVGTLFVALLLNGMTIMNLSYTVQNLIKSVVMLIALIAETLLNPRDEQTSQQGDI